MNRQLHDEILAKIVSIAMSDSHTRLSDVFTAVGELIGKCIIRDDSGEFEFSVKEMILATDLNLMPGNSDERVNAAFEWVEMCKRKGEEALRSEYQALEEAGFFEDVGPVINGKPATWKVKCATMAIGSFIPTEWIIQDFLEKESLSIIYGAPGGHKSNLAFDLAMAVALGEPFLPGIDGKSRGLTTKQGNVFWIDLDNGAKRMHNRLHAYAGGYLKGATQDIPLYYTSMPSPMFDASQPHASYQLIQQIRAIDASLVVVDNLGLVTGDVEEVSSEMARVMSTFRYAIEETNCSFVIIHHQRKGSADKGHGDDLRGSSAINAALDSAYVVKPDSVDGTKIAVYATKTRGFGHRELNMVWRYTWHEGDSKDLASARFYATDDKAMSDLEYAQEILLNELKHHNPLTQRDIVQTILIKASNKRNVTEQLIRKAINRLVQADLVKVIERPGQANLYTA